MGVQDDKFKITKGADELNDYKVTDTATRRFCKKCGTTILKKRDSHTVG